MTATDVASEGSHSSSPPIIQPSATTTNANTDTEPNTSSNPKLNEANDDGCNKNNNNGNNSATADADDISNSSYHLKWIPWNTGKIPIVMQSKNGPCPLIATMNVLLLREKVKLPDMLEQITESQLFTYLGECLMDSIPITNTNAAGSVEGASTSTETDENLLLNIEQNVHDAIEILPRLRTGLDVNIRFTGITDFEYTPECIIFDLLNIPLYHGWLCDPTLIELQNAIGSQSYNQVVDNIITHKNSTDPTIQAKVFIAEEFLERTASQLTLHGLEQLKSKIKNNEIGILFRNNHFLTMFKRENEIYTLVTDHGYLTEDNIIWETLDNIEGAGSFFDANFLSPDPTSTKQANQFEEETKRRQQLEMDYLLALSLREDEPLSSPEQQQTDANFPNSETTQSGNDGRESPPYGVTITEIEDKTNDLILETDYELAKRLQAEEDRHANEAMSNRNERDNQKVRGNDEQAQPRTNPTEERNPVNQNNTGTANSFSYSQVVQQTPNSGPVTNFEQQQQQQSKLTPAASSSTTTSTDTSGNNNNRRHRNEKNTKDPNCSVM